jgi:hypothetical protein
MENPEAGVALAMKLTGDVTVAPLAGVHTTRPGVDGAEHAPVVAPVPVKETLCGLPVAESVIVTAPVLLPDCVGLKVTVMLQLDPAFRLVPQLLVCAKSPLPVIPLNVSVDPPLFVSVTDCAELVVPTC